MLVDSHAHIQGKEYAGEVEAVIARARSAGVETIIAVGGAGDIGDDFPQHLRYRRHASA
jgi:Tat protein secretion system quality control protein TatD with DNase activity